MEDSFVKIYTSILSSSIWLEDSDTRVLWITMLAMGYPDGIVVASVGGLAKQAGISRGAAEIGIQKFLSPDEDSKNGIDDGRRVERIENGWKIINFAKYRDRRTEKQLKDAERKKEAYNRVKSEISAFSADLRDSPPISADLREPPSISGFRAPDRDRDRDRDRDKESISIASLDSRKEEIPLVDRILALTNEEPKYRKWWLSIVRRAKDAGTLDELRGLVLTFENKQEEVSGLENVGAYLASCCKNLGVELPKRPRQSSTNQKTH